MWYYFLLPISFPMISSQARAGSVIILAHVLFFNFMASPPYSYTDMYGTQQALPLLENVEEQYIPSGDPSSVSYIPRAARSVPHAHTVHTVHVKKVTYPLTSRLPELWLLETNQDGLETWRSIGTFLGNLQLSHDPRVLRAVANQWRIHYTKFNQFRPHRLRPSAPTPRTLECAVWTTRFNRSGPYVHSPIVLVRSAYHHSQGPPNYIRYICLPLALHLRHHRPGYLCDTVLLHARNRHLLYIALDLLDLA